MSDTNFVPGTVVRSTWLNDVNNHVYKGRDFAGITPINVKDPVYGVVGNGIANDTAGIQAAINACPTPGVLYFPSGFTYKGDNSTNIIVKPELTIIADGAILNGIRFRYAPGGALGFPGRIKFYGLNMTGVGGTAIFIDANAPQCEIRGCSFDGYGTGVYLKDCYGSTLENNKAVGCGHGYQLVRSSHATTVINCAADFCTIAGLSINYGGPSGVDYTHNVNVVGGWYQNCVVGIWAEQIYELHTSGVYHEGNTTNDYRLGVADGGVYARACYNVIIDGLHTASPCASGINIRLEHVVGISMRGLAFNNGCSTTASLVSADGFCGRINLDYFRYTTITPTATAPFNFTLIPDRVTISNQGKLTYGTGATDAISFGTLNNQLGSIYSTSIGGRDMLTLSSVRDVRLVADGLVRFHNPAGTTVAAFDLSSGALPTTNPGAGSKQFWVDTADSNRVKFAV